MRKLLAALPLLLGGCASITDVMAPAYVPQPIRVYDASQYQADVAECRAAGIAYKPSFSIGTVLARSVQGATSNTSLIPVSPLVPAYGAAGAALGATSDGLDVMSGQHSAVFRNCLHDELRRDGSAVLVDPRN